MLPISLSAASELQSTRSRLHVMYQWTIFVVSSFLIRCLLSSPIYSNTSDSTYLNVWQQTSEWQCNAPLAQDHLALSLYRSESRPEEKFLLLYGGSLTKTTVSDETWSFSLQSKAWSRLSAKTGTERPSGRRFHSLTTLCGTTVLLFGGKGKGGKALNDSWIFESDTKTWKRPAVVSDFPVPALFRHAALAVHDPHSNCSCKQSILILSGQSHIWSSLWEIRCIRDRLIYEWRNYEFQCNTESERPTQSETVTCPMRGNARLSVSIVNESAIITIAENGLWKYAHLQQNWTILTTKFESHDIARFKIRVTSSERAVYMPQRKRYVIFDGRFKSKVTYYSLDTREWKRKHALGHNDMASIAAVTDGNAVIAYGGTSGSGCHQYFQTLINTGNMWVWIYNVTVVVQPSLAPQFVLGVMKDRLYLCGKSVRQRQKRHHTWSMRPISEMWVFNIISMQWWKLGFVPEAGQTVCGRIRDSYRSVSFQSNRFVVFGSLTFKKSPPLHIYYTLNNTWETQTTRLTPEPRGYHSLSSYNRTTAILFGGRYKHPRCHNCWEVLNDLWMLKYDDETLEWIRIHNNSLTRHYPSARMRHAMVVIGTWIYVFGGNDISGQVLNDLWKYDILRDLWVVVETANVKPVTHSSYWRSLATTVGNQMIMTLGCYDTDSDPADKCNITQPQETWLYSPENNIWMRISSTSTLSVIFGARSGPSTPLICNRGSLILINALNTLDKARIYYMTFACPKGYYSNNITSEPCRPCPTGKYSNTQRDNCQNCPDKLTTAFPGMHSVYQCSQCEKRYCTYGKCLVAHNGSDIPEPKCECTFGFTGGHCNYPTYYLLALGIVIVVTVALLLLVSLVNAAKRKQLRERKLRSQVDELLSAWQIGHEEISLLERVGSGASGKVYRSVYREITVAVKMFNMTDDLGSNSEIAREIRFMQTIRHPNVVLFIGAGRTAVDCPFLVTEFMARGSLRDVLDNRTVTLSFSRKVQFTIGAAKGLNFLHTLNPPRIHRDVKSANLLVSDEWVVKVADFGLGRQVIPKTRRETNTSRLSHDSLLSPLIGDEMELIHQIGTARWRAPELSRGWRYNQAVDVYRCVCFVSVCVCVCRVCRGKR